MNPLVTSLLFLVAAGTPSVAPGARSALVLQEDEAFEALEKEYDRAALDWRSELREAKKAGDAAAEEAVLARNPVKDYYPRFAPLADGGSARAAFWMATRVELAATDVEWIRAEKARLFAQAVRGLGATKEAKDVLKALGKSEQKQFLDAPVLEQLYSEFAKATKDPELGSKALLARAENMMARSTSGEEREKAVQALEELVKSYPESKAAQGSEDLVYRFRNLSVGCVAPAFTTQDVDGAEFELTDYRGKVVLVDFWGFW